MRPPARPRLAEALGDRDAGVREQAASAQAIIGRDRAGDSERLIRLGQIFERGDLDRPLAPVGSARDRRVNDWPRTGWTPPDSSRPGGRGRRALP